MFNRRIEKMVEYKADYAGIVSFGRRVKSGMREEYSNVGVGV
jgi:hypothetical protein